MSTSHGPSSVRREWRHRRGGVAPFVISGSGPRCCHGVRFGLVTRTGKLHVRASSCTGACTATNPREPPRGRSLLTGAASAMAPAAHCHRDGDRHGNREQSATCRTGRVAPGHACAVFALQDRICDPPRDAMMPMRGSEEQSARWRKVCTAQACVPGPACQSSDGRAIPRHSRQVSVGVRAVRSSDAGASAVMCRAAIWWLPTGRWPPTGQALRSEMTRRVVDRLIRRNPWSH